MLKIIFESFKSIDTLENLGYVSLKKSKIGFLNPDPKTDFTFLY